MIIPIIKPKKKIIKPITIRRSKKKRIKKRIKYKGPLRISNFLMGEMGKNSRFLMESFGAMTNSIDSTSASLREFGACLRRYWEK